MDLFTEIVDIKNIRKAYLKICESFDLKLKTFKYSGIDSKRLYSFDLSSEKMFVQIQKELIDFKTIDPAILKTIPKKSKAGNRIVYLHTLKERVKAQAVYQILEPIFENYYSKYLFSYRKSHTHGRAIKNFCKLYRKKNFEYFLIGDISNYSDNLNKKVLVSKLAEIGFDESIMKVFNLYIENQYIEEVKLKKYEKGIITGLPVTILFNNIYLDQMDKKISAISDFYMRVGDDFIVMSDLGKLEIIKDKIEEYLDDVHLTSDKRKIDVKNFDDEFIFMGYKFSKGIISIPEKSINKIKIRWRRLFKYYPINKENKIKRLGQKLFGKDGVYNDLIQVVYQYNQMNDFDQIKEISEYFFGRICIFFYEKINYKNLRKLKIILKKYRPVSIVKLYTLFHFEGKDIDYLQKFAKRNTIK